MVDKPKACIFCGATPLSKEHIWSEWTYKILPRIKGASHTRGVIDTSRITTKEHRIVSQKTYQGSVNSIKLRAVCTSKPRSVNSLGNVGCNNGWMSDLETAVKPIVTPLILDQQTILGKERLQTLASWIATKVMVAEYSDPPRVVSTAEDRKFLMETGEPPATWKIWIGRQDGRSWYMKYRRHSATLVSSADDGSPVIPLTGTFAKNTQLATFGMGYLIIHVLSSSNPDVLAKIDYPSNVALFRIHPSGAVSFGLRASFSEARRSTFSWSGLRGFLTAFLGRPAEIFDLRAMTHPAPGGGQYGRAA
jgi:hypothetical protein